MLDARITVINGKMHSFDRKSKFIKFDTPPEKPYFQNYDILVLAVGLVDKTIEELITNEKNKFKKELSHLYSIDDPYLYSYFEKSDRPDSPYALLTHRKRPQNICVYGASLHTISFISGLIKRGISAERIHLVIPPRSYEVVSKFNQNSERIDQEDHVIFPFFKF